MRFLISGRGGGSGRPPSSFVFAQTPAAARKKLENRGKNSGPGPAHFFRGFFGKGPTRRRFPGKGGGRGAHPIPEPVLQGARSRPSFRDPAFGFSFFGLVLEFSRPCREYVLAPQTRSLGRFGVRIVIGDGFRIRRTFPRARNFSTGRDDGGGTVLAAPTF